MKSVKLINSYKLNKEINPTKKVSINITCGKPVLVISYSSIKLITVFTFILLVTNIILATKYIIWGIQIRLDLGYLLNLISSGEGDTLPTLQVLPVTIFLLINILNLVFCYKLFNKRKEAIVNLVVFILQMICVFMILGTYVVLIIILSHIYGAHEYIHNGITDGIHFYSNNSLIKSQIDRLQIELQCCGSKNYDEWYKVEWYEKSLMRGNNSRNNVPFSCCLITSMYPCIHHNIEQTGNSYLYAPEYNLSVSTDGCFTKLFERKQTLGWLTVGNLLKYNILQVINIIHYMHK